MSLPNIWHRIPEMEKGICISEIIDTIDENAGLSEGLRNFKCWPHADVSLAG
ncbi:MAG: hypothetical protein JWL90_3729 [Chthoniobacteraceae bacterium]|nr:hypothetical protein [Chthoniobacteraceae bacterium]